MTPHTLCQSRTRDPPRPVETGAPGASAAWCALCVRTSPHAPPCRRVCLCGRLRGRHALLVVRRKRLVFIRRDKVAVQRLAGCILAGSVVDVNVAGIGIAGVGVPMVIVAWPTAEAWSAAVAWPAVVAGVGVAISVGTAIVLSSAWRWARLR